MGTWDQNTGLTRWTVNSFLLSECYECRLLFWILFVITYLDSKCLRSEDKHASVSCKFTDDPDVIPQTNQPLQYHQHREDENDSSRNLSGTYQARGVWERCSRATGIKYAGSLSSPKNPWP